MQNHFEPETSLQDRLKSLSNAKFLKWFFLLDLAVVLGLVWTGPGALIIPLLGMGGSLIALLLAKWSAKRVHNIHVINPNHFQSELERQLYVIVERLSIKANLPKIPEVGIYDSPDINAFATGATPSFALVAFSTSLLDKMNETEVEAVAAHEIAHIANRDMLGMVLIQGIINSIVLLFTLPIVFIGLFGMFMNVRQAFLLSALLRMVRIAVATVLTFLGSLVLKAFSRTREYRADAFATVLLEQKEPMINALKTLANDNQIAIPKQQEAFAAFKVSGRDRFSEWFSTHPLIEKRIKALENSTSISQQVKKT